MSNYEVPWFRTAYISHALELDLNVTLDFLINPLAKWQDTKG
jgi:hypothetical protein